MDETQEIIKEQLKKLPKDLRDAISSVDLRDKIRKISEKHHLHIDQAGNLEDETVLVMIGLEPTADYKENLKRELNISRDRAQAITADMDKEIFAQVRQSLKKISESRILDDEHSNSNEANFQREEIHHSPLVNLVTPLPSESEEIKRQIAEQRKIKPTVPVPPNLPTGEPNGEARPLNLEKKPIHIDPYREPVE